MPSPKAAKKGRPHLKRDEQQWFFDWMVKEQGKTFHFQPDGRGRLPRTVRSHNMMRVIALIEDAGVIRRILEHLGLWAPLATERSPPLDPVSWPRHASLPLTYHPVPDIA